MIPVKSNLLHTDVLEIDAGKNVPQQIQEALQEWRHNNPNTVTVDMQIVRYFGIGAEVYITYYMDA